MSRKLVAIHAVLIGLPTSMYQFFKLSHLLLWRFKVVLLNNPHEPCDIPALVFWRQPLGDVFCSLLDYHVAFKWMESAALQVYKGAQMTLSKMYAGGDGVARDINLSAK